MHIKYNRGSVMLAYIGSRRIEQYEDNEERKGSKSKETALGVDYHMVRKEAAAALAAEIRPLKSNGITLYYLSPIGKEFWKELVNTGISRQTVISWLKKYEDFDHTLITNLKG